MLNFHIDPDYCLVIKALSEAGTLRGAAILLGTDPAHLTRKVQKISAQHDLIRKAGSKWILTESGRKLAQWVDESIVRQKVLLEQKPLLRVACYTWLAEQMLIPGFPRLNRITGNKMAWSFNVVADDLEKEIISGRTDYVITCHSPNDPLIAHKKFTPDPWYVVVPASWKKEIGKKKGEELIAYLQAKPFLRLANLNPDQTLGFAHKNQSELLIEGIIGVRAAVISGLGWSCLPGFSLITAFKNEEVLKLDLPSATKGDLSVWWLRSRKDAQDNVKALSKWVSELVR